MKRLTIVLAAAASMALTSGILVAGCTPGDDDNMSNSASKGMNKSTMTHPKSAMGKKMMKPPFGSKDDIAFATQLWSKLDKAGYGGLHGHLYVGAPPHGKVREVMEGIIDGDLVIYKTNYRGKDVTVKNVQADPKKYLKAVTVMVKRKGYDPKDDDWFWIKYTPTGMLMKQKGMALAGRVAKGMPTGCISCHQSAAGSDFVFSHNKKVNKDVTWIGKKAGMKEFHDLMNP